MYRLPSIIVLLLGTLPLLAQSPHGDGLKIDCAQCHNTSGWTLDYETLLFDHDTTNFELEGTHSQTDCKACHNTLVFEGAPQDCISCHVDIHNQSVGNDCMRCHNSDSWLVFTIPEIHEENGFPLIGVHTNLSCIECHTNETTLIFNPIGNECIQCHRDDYLATQDPNHPLSGFSESCDECHDPFGMDWGDITGINHDFFPLTLGHDIQDCSSCHEVSNFSNISADCFACHEDDYVQSTNPNHQAANFPIDCIQCHTTNPGWMPAILDHDFFPLTLGHDIQDCNDCHISGNFNNTPTDCFACHENDYNQTTDPNHIAAGFPTDCVQCHSTNPGWMPAILDHDFFPLTLGHDIQDCNDCHINGNFNNTPTDCFACHEDDYNQTTDPDHIAAGFPTDCVICHTTNPGWMPTTWDHDGMYFPIYSGPHEGEWNACMDCHMNPNDYSVFTCLTCHDKPQTNDEHDGVPGYVYESNACLQCHPDGTD
jgi:hypothetical protein